METDIGNYLGIRFKIKFIFFKIKWSVERVNNLTHKEEENLFKINGK